MTKCAILYLMFSLSVVAYASETAFIPGWFQDQCDGYDREQMLKTAEQISQIVGKNLHVPMTMNCGLVERWDSKKREIQFDRSLVDDFQCSNLALIRTHFDDRCHFVSSEVVREH